MTQTMTAPAATGQPVYAKLACRAVSCYNKHRNIGAPAMLITSGSRTKLNWSFVMDTIPQDSMPRKQCSKCERFFPATPEFFRRNGTGLRPDCKECKSREDKVYRQAHADKQRAYQKVYRQSHINERRAYDRDYIRSHAEGRRARDQAHAEHIYEKQREYRAAHAEEISIWRRTYRLAHIEKERAITRNRHARKKSNGGIHTEADIQKQYANQKGKCYYCQKKVGKTYHVDHVIPLSRGGSNDPSNLVIACTVCNARKYNKLPHEWPEGGRLF